MKRTMIAFSFMSNFQVRLPAGDNQNLIIHIRDTLDCITEVNLNSTYIVSDNVDLIKSLQSSTNNPIAQLLISGNQNTVGQIITSISQEFNKMNNEMIDKATSRGIPLASFSVSPLGSKTLQKVIFI
jgi:hypothetical protein